MWYVCDVLYAVLYVRVSCFVVRGCAVLGSYIHVCNCDMFSVVNVYLDHFKFCVVCIGGGFFGRKNFIQKKNPTKKYRVDIIYMIMTKIRRYKIINKMK